MITLADAELAANVYPGLFDIASEPSTCPTSI